MADKILYAPSRKRSPYKEAPLHIFFPVPKIQPGLSYSAFCGVTLNGSEVQPEAGGRICRRCSILKQRRSSREEAGNG